MKDSDLDKANERGVIINVYSIAALHYYSITVLQYWSNNILLEKAMSMPLEQELVNITKSQQFSKTN